MNARRFALPFVACIAVFGAGYAVARQQSPKPRDGNPTPAEKVLADINDGQTGVIEISKAPYPPTKKGQEERAKHRADRLKLRSAYYEATANVDNWSEVMLSGIDSYISAAVAKMAARDMPDGSASQWVDLQELRFLALQTAQKQRLIEQNKEIIALLKQVAAKK